MIYAGAQKNIGPAGLTLVIVRRYLARLPRLIVLESLFIAAYGAFLAVSLMFMDARTPLDARLLVPVYVAIVIVGLYFLHDVLTNALRRRVFRVAAGVTLVVLLGSHGLRTATWATTVHGTPQGLWQAQDWAMMATVDALPDDTLIYSNGADIIYILTGRTACPIPRLMNPNSEMINTRYAAESATMREHLHQNDGVLVYFDEVSWRDYLPTQSMLAHELSLRAMVRTRDGTLYAATSTHLPAAGG